MCFSAQVSFGAAGILAAIGIQSLRSVPSRRHVPLAAIPMLFAVQQAIEGAIWLELEAAPFGKSDTRLGMPYLFFALFVWPWLVPAALALIERSRPRRNVLVLASAGGFALGSYLLACASFRESDACIAFRNIYYWVQLKPSIKDSVPYLYLAFISGSLSLSSVPGTSLLGSVVAVSFALTAFAYRAGFLSVWCFFVALISAVVAVVVREGGASTAWERKGAEP